MPRKSSQVKRIKRDIIEVSDESEKEWYDQQKELKKNKTEELLERGKHLDDYKSWGGTYLCIGDMKAVVPGKSDDDYKLWGGTYLRIGDMKAVIPGKSDDDYKSWGGTFLCIDDMKAVIPEKSDDDQRKILHHE